MANERDDFWDIEKLIPKKKNNILPFSTKEKTVDYVIPGEREECAENNKLTVPVSSANEKECITYKYESGFIRTVTINKFIDKYDFYGNFRKAALVYYDFKTPKCDFVPFYSYMPQYSQLTSPQKSFYFYWRDMVRRKKYIKTDYSYLYLYVYEILNLPDKIPAEEGLELLLSLWRAYRDELPAIDHNMSLWVQDYCLIYGIPCPTEKISDFIFDVIGTAEFKEFYLADVATMGDDGTAAMIAYLSDYDWRCGRYAGGDNREAYRKHLLGAMGMLISELWRDGIINSGSGELAKIQRNAFRNSLCTHSVKCRIDIEYLPVSKVDNIRRSVTAALKYTENKLRALIGVKSRIGVKELPEKYKAIIDAYFSDVFEKANKERQREMQPEYERLYDAESSGISFEGADEIERLSWTTTARLVATEEFEDVEEEYSVLPEPETSAESNEFDSYSLNTEEIEFVDACLRGDAEKIKLLAASIGMVGDAVKDKINEAFADGFGDIIIEGDFPNFYVISDYEEDIKEWLIKIMK